MPLIHGHSREAVESNIREMIHAGHPRAQAVAAALSTARRYADGGSYLAGTAGTPVNLSGLGAPAPVRPTDLGILPSGFMATPQVGTYLLDPQTGALTPAAQAALRALAMRGLNPAPAAADDPNARPDTSFNDVLYGRELAGGADRGSDFGGMASGLELAALDRDARNNELAGAAGMKRGGSTATDAGDHPSGLIVSPIGGRSDQIPMHLASGSYVIPADVMSGIGQGNTLSGGHVFDAMIAAGPHKTLPLPKLGGELSMPNGMPMTVARHHYARGGRMKGRIPVIVAGGERIVSPDEVARLSGGDVERGHKMLDDWVVRARKHVTAHTSKLPGPVKT